MKVLVPLLLFGLTVFSSCGPAKPKAEDVYSKIVGNYCSEGYRLELRADSTFFNMRVTAGAFGNKPLVERCEGKYSLAFDESSSEWQLHFKKESRGFSMASCTGNITIWSKKTGWAGSDSTLTLPEWFDKKPVRLGACEI